MSAADRALQIFRSYSKTRETHETNAAEFNRFNRFAFVSPVSPSPETREIRETEHKSLSELQTAEPVSLSRLSCVKNHKFSEISFAGSALARLNPDAPPCDVPAGRWASFINDGQRFLTSDWADRAIALGWTLFDLFGCDRNKPYARIDRMGLLWQLNGQRLLALTGHVAVISTADGGSLTFRKVSHHLGGRALAWQLV